MIAAEIQSLLQEALSALKIEETTIPLSHPANLTHGDYASSVALKLGKSLKKNPVELAQEIVKNIPQNDIVEKALVAPPGFINITLLKSPLLKELHEIGTLAEDYGKKEKSGKTILLEFGQPNTHKTPHIGHLFSYVYGESLVRILEHQGNTVKRVNWQGDVGLHVAKCLYALTRQSKKIDELGTLRDKIALLQKCYQEGSKLYEEDENAQLQIDKLNQKIYRRDPEIIDLWEETRKLSLEFFKVFEEILGVTFDKYYFESEGGPVGKKIILENIDKVFEESEGAIILKGEKYGLHTRVFINTHGNPTYEGKEVGLNYMKMNDFNYDRSITTTASEQNEFFKVAFKACELLFPHLTGKLHHIGFGMVNLSSGKMSSRTGQIIDAVSLYELLRDEIKSEYQTEQELTKKIALSAIKYSFLHSEARLNKTFDIQKSIAKVGDCGPYLLYTYVRCISVLKKENYKEGSIPDDITLNDVENVLLRTLYQYPEVVERAAETFAPHLITQFLYEVAKNYNLFYQTSPILHSAGEVRTFRLTLTNAVQQTLKKGLYLLGIETVEKM